MSVALNMIVGPYEELFLEAAIASCYSLCDEFIFIDTAPGNNPSRWFLDEFKDDSCVSAAVYDDPHKKVTIIDMPRGEDKDFSFAEARELARVNTESEWVLRLDADEVLHETDVERLKKITSTNCTSIEVAFYHFMVYPWLYQYIEPKTILMKTDSFTWVNGVHEIPRIVGRTIRVHDIKYYHYGYCRGQEEVFKRWQLYVDIDGRPEWYKGVNPNSILDDRISVCQNFKGEHPLVVQDTLAKLFSDVPPFQVKEILRYKMSANSVGLLLITYNDLENLLEMIPSFEATVDYPVQLLIVDMGSTDGTVDFLYNWRNSIENNYLNVTIEEWTHLESLTKTMNFGFSQLMSHQECDYIGWIHGDMIFEQDNWLSELVATLQVHPKLAKVCSFNIRDGQPQDDEFIEGQEQAYIVRRGVLFKVGLFDEKFIGIGGYEDWDLNNRIRQEGWKVVITPKSKVWHKGMATRERRDTSAEQIYNAGVYRKKWKTNEENIQ
jgi:glycosyltransferase involved in cell wall biosynthesis